MTAIADVKCGQQCGENATVYAMDRLPGGWAGWYCEPCATGLNFLVTDRVAEGCVTSIVIEQSVKGGD